MLARDDAPPVPSLRTRRLVLRGWQEADLAPFAALNADPEVARFLGSALTRPESDALVGRIVDRWRDDGFGLWAVERVEDGAFLGFTGLSVPAWAPSPDPEVGWRFARAAWGKGYATEAAEAAVRFAFETLGLPRIVSYTTVSNVRSRRVMERLGMTRASDTPFDFLHPRLAQSHPLREHVAYHLAREDWEAARRGRRLGSMDKSTLLQTIRETHEALAAAAEALDDEALLGPAPGMDGWTRKDVLAHVEWWNGHSATVIAGVRTGIDPYPGGEEPWDPDAWNARILDENRDRPAADVRRGETESFARLVAAVEGATEAELFAEDPQPWLDGTLAETVEDDSTRHYPEHVPHLR